MARPPTPHKEAIMLSKKVLVSILVIAVAVFLIMGGSALAQPEEEELEDASVFIEWNSSDEDQGLQFFWDSEGFTLMEVFNEDEQKVLRLKTFKKVKKQGLTETAIESVEPGPEEQTLQQFLNRFPEELYTFEGELKEGGVVTKTITGAADLTHDLLEPVVFTKINLPVIEWTEPTEDYLTGDPLDVVGYELVVELVIEVNGDERVFKETTNYPAGVTKHIVGNRFMKLIKNPPGDIIEGKVEILADEPSGNRTITEEAFIEEE
jgi:hypothetical protein